MMGIYQTYCGHHYRRYVSQITVMLYTSQLHTAVRQPYLNKTGGGTMKNAFLKLLFLFLLYLNDLYF